MAMRILSTMGRAMNAPGMVRIESAHVDGCLLHGKSGVTFAEKLVSMKGKVRVPTTLNVGAMDLNRPENVRLDSARGDLAVRLMNAYVAMGGKPTWTCAPYQAGFRPRVGAHVAWAESNAVVFANSVLGARTNRYGDFMDICCALTGYAPYSGMHRPEHRVATVLVDASPLPDTLWQDDAAFAVLGSWLGRSVGKDIAVIDGMPVDISEDRLKALGAAAASTGSVALFHIAGVTPEAPDVKTALGGNAPARVLTLTQERFDTQRDRMSTARGDRVDVVAVGSPHFSLDEFTHLIRFFGDRRSRIPFYACTGRHVLSALDQMGGVKRLEQIGVQLILDTCVVVTAVIPGSGGVLMTNSGKFAHYSPSLIRHDVVFGSLADCVESAVAGRVLRARRHSEPGA